MEEALLQLQYLQALFIKCDKSSSLVNVGITFCIFLLFRKINYIPTQYSQCLYIEIVTSKHVLAPGPNFHFQARFRPNFIPILFRLCPDFVESCVQLSDDLISISFSMPAFCANLFRLFNRQFVMTNAKKNFL